MATVKIKVEVEKELQVPDVYDIEQITCVGFSRLDCSNIKCENCLFDYTNYLTLLKQQKGE